MLKQAVSKYFDNAKAGDYSSVQYQDVRADEETSGQDRSPNNIARRQAWDRWLSISLTILPWILSAVLMCIIVYYHTHGADRFHQHKLYASQLTYSPAQDMIEYELRMYHSGLTEAPEEFQGPPSKELDKAWDSLYNFGISTISKSEAMRMTNYTSPVPNHEDRHIMELDVFHQLHCLNMFRKALTPIYLQDWEAVKDPDISKDNWTIPAWPFEELEKNRVEHGIVPWHIGHCLESIRQSLMCHGDITPAVWHWDKSASNPTRNKPWLTVPHTCRNFDRLRDWGLKHKLEWNFDYEVRLPEEFEVPTYQGPGK